jgi:formate dehydrogenase major subunit
MWHPEDVLDINAEDAQARGVRSGDWVRLSSRFGQIELRAQISDRVNPGIVYTTFHHAKSKANAVTSDLSDWATNCPEYKVTAVDVVRTNGPAADGNLDAAKPRVEELEPAE